MIDALREDRTAVAACELQELSVLWFDAVGLRFAAELVDGSVFDALGAHHTGNAAISFRDHIFEDGVAQKARADLQDLTAEVGLSAGLNKRQRAEHGNLDVLLIRAELRLQLINELWRVAGVTIGHGLELLNVALGLVVPAEGVVLVLVQDDFDFFGKTRIAVVALALEGTL